MPTQDETKKIYQKSIRLLSDTQTQLTIVEKLLKKSVINLAAGSKGGDEKINTLLDNMSVSVNNEKLVLLDSQIDELLILIGRSKKHRTIVEGKPFCDELKNSLSELKDSIASGKNFSIVRDLASKELSDKELSVELLQLIDSISSQSSIKEGDHDTAQSIDEIEQNLPVVLVDFINGLSLPDAEAKEKQSTLIKKLKTPKSTDTYWKTVSDEMTLLVNGSVDSLQDKNNDLQTFIVDINNQLFEIKSFVDLTQKHRDEAISRSAELKNSVDKSVHHIHHKVSSADSIDELKTDISVYLENIKNEVEENNVAEQENERISVESFAHITNELNSTQNELTELKSQLKETKSQLLHDTLTGIYNRLAYEDRVEVEINRSKRNNTPLCVAMWDIDHFKKVNDTYGHDVGDEVLRVFAGVITDRIRKTDMFARIGGEEFVLLMPETSCDIALTLNDELRESFHDVMFGGGDIELSVTSSVGIADFCSYDTAISALKKADKALYESKSTGRNKCTIYQDDEEYHVKSTADENNIEKSGMNKLYNSVTRYLSH